jgi:hypothetical protein
MTISTNHQSGSVYTIFADNNQVVDFSLSGGAPMAGAQIGIQIGDGGVDNGGTSNNGGATVPVIQTSATYPIDMSQGVFALGNPNEGETYSPDGLIGYDASNTNSGTVPASGLLATVTLDASGVTPGTSFSVQLFNVGQNDADFSGLNSRWNTSGNVYTDFTGDGMSEAFTIDVIAPEPSMGLVTMVAIGWLLTRRTRQKRSML